MLFGKKTPKAQDVMEMIDKLSDEEKAELKIFLAGDAEDKAVAEVAEVAESDGETDTAEEVETEEVETDDKTDAESEDGEAEDEPKAEDAPDTAEEAPEEDATKEAAEDVIVKMQREIEGLHEAIKGIVARLDGDPDAKKDEESGETETADEEDALRKIFGAAMGDPGPVGSKRESDWEKAKNKYFPGI